MVYVIILQLNILVTVFGIGINFNHNLFELCIRRCTRSAKPHLHSLIIYALVLLSLFFQVICMRVVRLQLLFVNPWPSRNYLRNCRCDMCTECVDISTINYSSLLEFYTYVFTQCTRWRLHPYCSHKISHGRSRSNGLY